MKYFVDAAGRAASGHENYIEFQKTSSKEDFWDNDSLYMSEEVMLDSGFFEFWEECVMEHGSGFMDAIYAKDWSIMTEEAKKSGGVILEIVNELSPWLEEQYAAGTPYVGVVDEFDRELDRRRQQREAYPVNPKFYEEVRAIDDTLPFAKSEEEYEKLLRKYDMPSCFFPFSIFEPDKWE